MAMYQKLQNLATRSILGAFKGTPYKAMEIETALPSPEVRFERLCNRYSINALLVNAKHPIRQILIENTVDELNPEESENILQNTRLLRPNTQLCHLLKRINKISVHNAIETTDTDTRPWTTKFPAEIYISEKPKAEE